MMWMALWSLALGQAAPAAEEVSLALRPYRVKVWLDSQPAVAFPETMQATLRRELLNLVDRYLADAWQVTMTKPPPLALLHDPPHADAMAKLAEGADKVFWIRLGAASTDWLASSAPAPFAVREYDVELKDWGPAATDVAPLDHSFSFRVFTKMHRQFRAHAEVGGGRDDGSFQLTVRGIGLQPVDSQFPLVAAGAPMRLYRDFIGRDKKVTRLEIPWSYMIYRERVPESLLSRGELTSGLRFALSTRTRRRSRVLAVATGIADRAETLVEFVNANTQVPVVGYEVGVRVQDKQVVLNLGNTDHRGRIAIRPVQLATEQDEDLPARTVQVLLLAGTNVLASFPMVPGEKAEAKIAVRIDPLIADISGRMLALQDEVVDIVAQRSILRRRLDYWANEKNDVEKSKELAAQINALPGKEVFDRKLEALRRYAVERQKALNLKNMSAGVNRLFLQTENLLTKNLVGREVTVDVEETTTTKPKAGGT